MQVSGPSRVWGAGSLGKGLIVYASRRRRVYRWDLPPAEPPSGLRSDRVDEVARVMTGLRRSELAPDPFAQFDAWYRDALAAHVVAPDAMTLATASKECLPSARMVLLKGYDRRGFVFYTNYESQKGRELAENPHAAIGGLRV